jgi:hypothetical protein
VIRVSVVFPTTDWTALPQIRSAARGLSGVHGLIEVRVATREEPAPGAASTGPVAEVLFQTADQMREALEAEAWERLLGAAAGDAPIVRAYAVGGVVLAGGAGAGDPTTDVEVAAEEAAAEPGEAEPLSTQMHLPLSRPAPPEDEDGGEAGGAAP